MTTEATPDTDAEQAVRDIAKAAHTVLRAHPGCGAIADLAVALRTFPGDAGHIEVERHLEDAEDEAYREVWRLKRINRSQAIWIKALEQLLTPEQLVAARAALGRPGSGS